MYVEIEFRLYFVDKLLEYILRKKNIYIFLRWSLYWNVCLFRVSELFMYFIRLKKDITKYNACILYSHIIVTKKMSNGLMCMKLSWKVVTLSMLWYAHPVLSVYYQ